MSEETPDAPDGSGADSAGRRQTDRRKSQQPFDGPDRRATTRSEGLDTGEG
jgi:hypothetical protein